MLPIVPAGLMVMDVPAFDFTSSILDKTLLRATSILRTRAILMANISTIAPDLIGLRRLFFTPRVITFIECVSPFKLN